MSHDAIRLRAAIARALLRAPGGRHWLAVMRWSFRAGLGIARFARRPRATLRRRRERPAWPWTEQDEAILARRVAEERPFHSSNRLAGRCRYVYRPGGSFVVHEDNENDWIFCRTSDVHELFAGELPEREFVLFTGHTDLPVDRAHRRYLRQRGLKAWFAVNAMLAHPKVRARPFGIGALAQPKDTATIRRVQELELPKRRLFHCQFQVDHNPFERLYCLDQVGLPLGPWLPWPEYLEDLASCYFCISPNGIGIDCVRTWEALLVRTIPIVRRSLVTEHHRDYPFIVLDDWAQFRTIEFTPELYERTWNGWDPDELLLDRYVQRIERALASEDVSLRDRSEEGAQALRS
jgi:hypothetical protein